MRSIRKQLTLGTLLALGVLLGGAVVVTYWKLRDSIYAQFDEALRVKALFVVTATQQRNNVIKVDFSDGFLREFDYDVATDFFQVFASDGRSITRSDSLSGRDLPLKAGTLENPVYWDLELPTNEPGRAIGMAFVPNQQNRRGLRKEDATVARVVVASDRSHLDALVLRLRVILGGASAAMLGMIVIVVPLVLRQGLRPLRRVAERASRIDANSLMERFPIEEMPAELQPIAGRLNDLLARLEGSFDRERRFSANLAHELRTPLAELRSQAELALKWPDERTADADRVVLEITLQMETLVERMLALARAEQSPANVKREEIALLPLAGELVAAIRPVVAARGLKIALAVPEEAAISADAVLLRSILSNLLENAANYGRSGGDITVSFSREAGRFALTVANPVDNLGAEDVPRLFERFWRKDSSRTGGTHAGLGLALSRSLAAQMGYSLDAALAANGVIAVTLTGAA